MTELEKEFIKITKEDICRDWRLAQFIHNANDIRLSDKNTGVFIDSCGEASDNLMPYGLVLTNGGMVIRGMSLEEFRGIVLDVYEIERKKDENKRRYDREAIMREVSRLLAQYNAKNVRVSVENVERAGGCGIVCEKHVCLKRKGRSFFTFRTERELCYSVVEDFWAPWLDWEVSQKSMADIETFVSQLAK